MRGEALLSTFHGMPARRPLLLQYTERMAEKCAQLRAALEAGDLAAVRRLGHHYRGSGGGFGYPAITAAGAALEQADADAMTLTPAIHAAAAELIALCERARLAFASEENQ